MAYKVSKKTWRIEKKDLTKIITIQLNQKKEKDRENERKKKDWKLKNVIQYSTTNFKYLND